jgi:hypothetical protein
MAIFKFFLFNQAVVLENCGMVPHKKGGVDEEDNDGVAYVRSGCIYFYGRPALSGEL